MTMTPEHWQQVKDLLGKALELTPAERSSFLDQACGSDLSLRNDVQHFLAAEENAGPRFLSALDAVDSAKEVLAAQEEGEEQEKDWRVGQLLGPYKLVSIIGEGGMGAVYRAKRADDEYETEVAVKLVQAGRDSPSVMARFRNERQILATLDHPNIARLHDGGTTPDGVPYFVMELIAGEPIDQYCDHHKLGIDRRLNLFLDVCSAAEYAHRRLIVHRDIKPGNILVTSEGVPKLLDFGIAKIVDPTSSENVNETAISLRVFTPAYASPEQVKGEPITTASDVYSLGVLLYELLTGHRPYPVNARTPETLSRAIREQEPERLSTVVRRVEVVADRTENITPESVSAVRECSPEKLHKRLSGDLDNIVLMALRKEPERRYGSVGQFAEDIRRHLKSLPVAARGDAIGYRTWKFVNRHRAGIASAAIASFALIMGTVVSVREARVARDQRARAERRFNDVRKLANSLLFDVHDAIRDLPGSTAARKVLLDKALQYLDSLAGEEGNDPALLRELATAYERVAEVQGHTLNDNLGDTGGSLRSYEKALSLRKQLLAAPNADWQDRLALASTSREVASQLQATGQPSSALEAVRAAISTSESVREQRPTDIKPLDELAYDYEIEGHIEGETMGIGLGDSQAAMRSYRRAVEVDEAWLRLAPDDTQALHSYETDFLFLGDSGKANGNLQEALNDSNRALEIAKTVSQRTGSPRRIRDVAVALNRVAQVYEDERNWHKALDAYEQALEIYKRLIERDPKDFMMRQGYAIALANVGIEKERIRPNSGIVLILQAADIMEKIVSTNKTNAGQRGILASVYSALGDAFKGQHRLRDALREYQKTLDLNKNLYADDRSNVDALNSIAATKTSIGGILADLGELQAASQDFLESIAAIEPRLSVPSLEDDVLRTAADSYAGLGDVELQLAKRSNIGLAAKREHWEKARSLFLKSRDAWQRIPAALQNSPNGPGLSTADEVKEKLERCENFLARAQLAMKH